MALSSKPGPPSLEPFFQALNVISTIANGPNGATTITLATDGSVNGLVQGMLAHGEGSATGATVGSFNTNTRVVTLSTANTAPVTGNVIFGDETTDNWTNIDI